MSNTVIQVEHLSKIYHLGLVGTGTFSRDLEVWWAKMRGTWRPILCCALARLTMATAMVKNDWGTV
jgi:hypothetical protein